MKHFSFLALSAVVALSAAAQDKVNPDDFMVMELGKDYEVTAFKPFMGKLTAPESGLIIEYNAMGVYTLNETTSELEFLKDSDRSYAGYINNVQAYQFSAVKGTTYYFWDPFPMNTGTIRLEMSPKVEITYSNPAPGKPYFVTEFPYVSLTFNQNVNIGKAVLSAGNEAEEVTCSAVGSNMGVNVFDVVNKWYDAEIITEGSKMTLALTQITDAAGKPAEDISLEFIAAGKPIRMVESKVPDAIWSWMPESADSTKAVFVFDGPLASEQEAILGYCPIELGYEYTEPLDVKVDGNTLTVDFAGKLRASKQMTAAGTLLPSFDLRLFTIRDSRGQAVYTGKSEMVGSFRYEIPYTEIPRLNVTSSFTPAMGESLAGEKDVKIYFNNADAIAWNGVAFTSGTDTVTVPAADVKVDRISDSEVELTVAIPQGWNSKKDVYVSLAGISTNDGYDHSKDIRAKYNGFTITFVDPAADAVIEQLRKNRTISIDTNLPAGAKVEFSILDGEGKAVYGPVDMKAAATAGSYVHTMTENVTLFSGTVYTMFFQAGDAGSESVSLIGSGLPYEFSSNTLEDVNPAAGSEIAPGSKITVRFSGLVALAPVNGSVGFTAVHTGITENFEGYDNTWEIALDPEADGNINLIFSAVDLDGKVVEGNEGIDENSHFNFLYTVTSEAISEISVANPAARGIFDLQGRPVANPVRGLYIINGHKVLVK